MALSFLEAFADETKKERSQPVFPPFLVSIPTLQASWKVEARQNFCTEQKDRFGLSLRPASPTSKECHDSSSGDNSPGLEKPGAVVSSQGLACVSSRFGILWPSVAGDFDCGRKHALRCGERI